MLIWIDRGTYFAYAFIQSYLNLNAKDNQSKVLVVTDSNNKSLHHNQNT